MRVVLPQAGRSAQAGSIRMDKQPFLGDARPPREIARKVELLG
ncbi:MAG TPA: hypothetical protein VIL06_01435 [Coriobacteriia bacterium]